MLIKVAITDITDAQTTANELILELEASGRKVLGVDIFTTRTAGNQSDPKVEVAIVIKYEG